MNHSLSFHFPPSLYFLLVLRLLCFENFRCTKVVTNCYMSFRGWSYSPRVEQKGSKCTPRRLWNCSCLTWARHISSSICLPTSSTGFAVIDPFSLKFWVMEFCSWSFYNMLSCSSQIRLLQCCHRSIPNLGKFGARDVLFTNACGILCLRWTIICFCRLWALEL